MKSLLMTFVLITACASGAWAQGPEHPDRKIWGILADLAGHSYVGVPPNDPKGAEDRDKWEWVLGGAVLRRTHVTANGTYAGETLFYYEALTKKIAYVYVTNDNYRTQGYIEVQPDGSCKVTDELIGWKEPFHVRGVIKLSPGGYRQDTEYQKAGQWAPGHAFVYKEAAANSTLEIKPHAVVPTE
jgi:hypothetical protein